jgi:hypothetical protein
MMRPPVRVGAGGLGASASVVHALYALVAIGCVELVESRRRFIGVSGNVEANPVKLGVILLAH